MSLSTTTLKAKIADLYGLEGDTTAEATAIKALDEAISEMNMTLWESLLSEETGIAFVEDQNYIAMPSLMYREKLAWWVKTSDGQEGPPMTYLDWATFKRMYGSVPSTNTGIPRIYSVFGNDQSSNIYVSPTPNKDAEDNYTMTVQFYPRLRSATTADADDQTLNVPAEWEVALLHKARQFFALLIAGPDAREIGVFQALFDEAIGDLRAIDRRHPDEKTRFRISAGGGRGRFRAGGIYTKID